MVSTFPLFPRVNSVVHKAIKVNFQRHKSEYMTPALKTHCGRALLILSIFLKIIITTTTSFREYKATQQEN